MLKPFTDKRLQTYKPIEKKQRISDPATKGLYFIIEALPSGTKSFAYRYTLDGQSKQITLGKYPVLSLADARVKVFELQKLIADGVDPKQERDHAKMLKRQKLEEQKFIEQAVTFKQAYEMYCQFKTKSIKGSVPDWSYDTLRKHNNRVYNFVIPKLGDRIVHELTERDLELVLLDIQSHGTLANRNKVRSLFKGLFDWVMYNIRDKDDQPLMSRNIALYISDTPFIAHKSKEFKHVTSIKEFGEIVKQVEAINSSYEVKQALKLAMLIFTRPQNITNMQWSQVNFDSATVTYSAEMMKMRNAFTSPLPTQAIELLQDMHALTGHSPYVFLTHYGSSGKPITRDSLTNALRRNKIELTAHGLRHSASTLLNEMGYKPDVIEAQLAHQIAGVRGVYNKAVYLEERRTMLQAWADLLDSLRDSINSN